MTGNPSPEAGGLWLYLTPLIFVGVAIARSARPRAMKIERPWISPLIILLAMGLVVSQQSAPSPLGLGADVVAFAIGAGLGWWRGRLTHISIDPATHALTSRTSPVGLALIGAIFLLRFALRDYATTHAGALHASVTDVTDAFLVLAVGLVCVQRLEMWMRARKLLADARAC